MCRILREPVKKLRQSCKPEPTIAIDDESIPLNKAQTDVQLG